MSKQCQELRTFEAQQQQLHNNFQGLVRVQVLQEDTARARADGQLLGVEG